MADPSSVSNAHLVRCKHIDIVWEVDFDAKTVSGSVTHDAEVLTDSTEIVFDASPALAAGVVKDGVTIDGEAAAVTVGAARGALGVPLSVAIPAGKQAAGSTFKVTIPYAVGQDATALQFLDPAQTADKSHPYLFTQCQAIHARSILPCQDAPGSKVTYSATVTVPAPLTALMSALRVDSGSDAGDGKGVFKFNQPVAMSTYLIALAVGLLESRDVGPRSTVWSEPSMVEAAAAEFADTEAFVAAGEAVLTPYVWGRYDLLCLPPSFPYGGMENPCLTFVTPTLLAGDKSLADVIAHECAHSWTGNLVTNATWSDFWLNEGCTMWVQRKIVSRVHGDKVFDFDVFIGRQMLNDSLAVFGETNPLTCLCPDLSGDVDPDDAFSSVPYEKGFSFLYYLCKTVGGFEAFDPFFKSYIETFSHKTVSSAQFREYFTTWFEGKADLSGIDWDTWFHTPGAPPVLVELDNTMRQACVDLATKWFTDPSTVEDEEAGFTTGQRIVFLDELTNMQADKPEVLTPEILAGIEGRYGYAKGRNTELRFRFLRLMLRAGDASAVGPTVAFVKEQGRMKFVRPLYRELFKTEFGKDAAVKAFQEHRAAYHPICSKMVANDLGVDAPAGK